MCNYICTLALGFLALAILLISIPIAWAEISPENSDQCQESPTLYVRLPNGLCRVADITDPGDRNVVEVCVTWKEVGQWESVDAMLRQRGRSVDFSGSAENLWPVALWFTIAAAILSLVVVLFAYHALYLHFGASKVAKRLNIVIVSLAAASCVIGWSIALASEQLDESNYRRFFPMEALEDTATDIAEVCNGKLTLTAGFGLTAVASAFLLIAIGSAAC